MASGKKNYFRHLFFARNDEFILGLIDIFGLQGYYYYFALLEICGEQAADSYPETFRFHKRMLIQSLRINTRKLNMFLGYLQDKCKISLTIVENQYEIIIPNFPKYLGKYQTKKPPNGPNKRKEKKRKEKESKVNKTDENLSDITHDDIINLFNGILAEKGNIKHAPHFMSRESIDNFKILCGFESFNSLEKWRSYFLKVLESPTLLGHDDDFSLNVSLAWLLKPNTAEKILSDFYQARPGQKLTKEGQRLDNERYVKRKYGVTDEQSPELEQ